MQKKEIEECRRQIKTLNTEVDILIRKNDALKDEIAELHLKGGVRE